MHGSLRHPPADRLPTPPASGLDGVVARLAEDLAGLAGDPVEAVEDLLGPVAAAALHREEPAAALVAASADASPLAAWVRAFVLGAAVPRRALAAAVPRTGVDGLERLGLLATAGAADDDEVRATVDLRPVGVDDAHGAATWWLASDQGASVTGAALGPGLAARAGARRALRPRGVQPAVRHHAAWAGGLRRGARL